MPAPFTFYEFFAGGGMARLGLGEGWRCSFAVDFDAAKAAAYRANHGDDHLRHGDVWALDTADLPGRADLAWASSPCQDLSLAGARAGLSGGRSSAFWGFWRLMEGLYGEGRAPRTIVIENVVGLLTSDGGADFAALCEALAGLGYRFGALEVDAALWSPQSRPRVFVVASLDPAAGPAGPAAFHTPAIAAAFERLPEALKARWVWWPLAAPARRNTTVADLLEPEAPWFPPERTERLLALMNPANRLKLEAARAGGGRRIGMAYRRVRVEGGERVQRAEVRFDGLAGCLRTPAGGSSRQFVVEVEGDRTRARLLTAREAARLMGLPDSYVLPRAQTAALKLCGDGVVVPVVRALAEQVLAPLLRGDRAAAA
ncbi:MAG TPA: DNA cytosine methyltransferase [Caulobacteraceae bacterium]|nr:DNA cytosine methyltransferase [Caulobacteraceae bacterium]